MGVAHLKSKMYSVNLDRMLARKNLNRSDLKMKISVRYLNKIALKITDWKTCAVHLGLSLQEINDIEAEQRRVAHRRLVSLHIWYMKNGEDATYINLAEALVQLERADLVQELVDVYLCQMHDTTDWAALYKATQSKLKRFCNGKLLCMKYHTHYQLRWPHKVDCRLSSALFQYFKWAGTCSHSLFIGHSLSLPHTHVQGVT